jgi:hypothetical protein
MEADSGAPAMEAIRRWSGIEAPNAAARYALADMQALIAELERARAGMGFEEEPSGFEAALRDLKEPEAR